MRSIGSGHSAERGRQPQVSDAFWDPASPSARRSFLLCGIGAIAGLLIAGYGLFTAAGTRTRGVPPEDAAIVNQVPILMTDYIAQLRTLYNVSLSQATLQQKRRVLDDMVRDELYVQRGLEVGLPVDDTDVRSALVTGAEAQAAIDATTSLPASEDLEAYYRRHQSRYASDGMMDLDDWIVPVSRSPQMNELVASLKAHADGRALGLVRSRADSDGLEFYFAAKIHLGSALFSRAQQMRDGDVSGPIRVGNSTHLLAMRHNQPSIPVAFSAVRSKVEADFIRDKTATLQASTERFLRRRADIRVAQVLQ